MMRRRTIPTYNEEEEDKRYKDSDLDHGIRDFVFSLRHMGFKTVGSCQGGVEFDKRIDGKPKGHTTPYPFVEISEPDPGRVRALVKMLKENGIPAHLRKELAYHRHGYPYYRIAISNRPVFRNYIAPQTPEEYARQSEIYIPKLMEWSRKNRKLIMV